MRTMKDSGIEWIGKIPEGWSIERGKNIMQKLERSVLEDDRVITCFRDGEVTLRANRREEGFTISTQETGYQGIEPGDLVVHGMDGFAGAIGISDSRGKATPVLNVLDSHEDKKYLMYYLRSAAYCGLFLSLATGIRVRTCDINWNKLKNVLFIIPPLREQQHISKYLDIQSSLIDRVVKKTKKTIEQYKKLHRTIITQAVTKGLGVECKIKNSGINWLGMIPDSWNVIALKYLCTMQAGKNLISEQIMESGLYPVYGGNGKRGYYNEYNCEGKRLLVGRQGALCGNVHKVEGKYWATEHAVITENTSICDIGYLYYLLIGMNLNQYVSSTAAQPGLAVSTMQSIRTCLPPMDEQIKIARYLDDKTDEICALITKKEQFIEELENYKKSMIYEYVTGKKEVPHS